MANDTTLTDVILLLTRVSSKVVDKMDKLEKFVGLSYRNQEADRKKNRGDANTDGKRKKKEIISEDSDNSPSKVLDETPMIIVSDFGLNARQFLTDLKSGFRRDYTDIGGKAGIKKGGGEEEESWISKFLGFLPIAGAIIGGLGGFLASIMSGDLGKMWDQIKSGDYMEALKTAGETVFKTVQPYIQSIPVIGPVYSFAQGYLALKKGDLIGGFKYIVQGFIGLTPLPLSVKAGMIGGVEFIGAMLKKKYGEETMVPNVGNNIMTMVIKSLGALSKSVKFFKKLPLIGPIINFYEAYKAFETGTPEGIGKGFLSLSAGITGLFPGIGTAISIGIDALNSLLFTETTTTDMEGRTVTKIDYRDWFHSTMDYLSTRFPLKNLVDLATGIEYISRGKYAQGFDYVVQSFPGLTLVRDLIVNPIQAYKETKTKGGNLVDFVNNITESIIKAFVDALPDAFGIRYHVAKFLGIKTNAPIPQSTNTSNNSSANVSDLQRNILNEAENMRAQQEQQNAAANEIGTRAMRLGQTQQVNDFIKTTDGKIIVPNKDDILVGLKPGGPLESGFKDQYRIISESNDILKGLSNAQSNLLTKQLKHLEVQTKLLTDISANINQRSNIVNQPTIVNNNYSEMSSLRSIQGVTA
jgi:hypothetical protein